MIEIKRSHLRAPQSSNHHTLSDNTNELDASNTDVGTEDQDPQRSYRRQGVSYAESHWFTGTDPV